MITSEREYQVVRQASVELAEALARMDRESVHPHVRMYELMRGSLQTELQLLQQELAAYEQQHGTAPEPLVSPARARQPVGEPAPEQNASGVPPVLSSALPESKAPEDAGTGIHPKVTSREVQWLTDDVHALALQGRLLRARAAQLLEALGEGDPQAVKVQQAYQEFEAGAARLTAALTALAQSADQRTPS